MKTTRQLWMTISLTLLLAIVGCGGGGTKQPPTLTGSWSGTATSSQGFSPVGITGNLTQGVTNPDGSIQFSGTLQLTNSCMSSLSISGKVAGGAFAFLGSNTDGSTLAVTATIDAQDTSISGAYTLTAGLVCPNDKGSVSLTKH